MSAYPKFLKQIYSEQVYKSNKIVEIPILTTEHPSWFVGTFTWENLSQLMRLWYLSHRRPGRLKRACTSTQSPQSLRSMEVDEGSDQKSDV